MADKAIGLYSGGLDSILATKLVLDLGIEVSLLHFVSPFCLCSHCHKTTADLNLPLRVICLKEEYIEMLKRPKYGYGKNFNPCIDCRILILSSAKKVMEEDGAKFIFTGEVLDERPMSQNKRAFSVIEKEVGLEGLILRPLSAKLLPPTKPEIEGLVDREKLLAIRGRSRKPQIGLAKRFGIENYPTPAGGCLLTYKEFSQKVRDALKFGEDSLLDMELLRYGRHFRLKSGTKVIVGRNEQENRILAAFGKDKTLLTMRGLPGPVAILYPIKGKNDLEEACRLCARYSDAKGLVELLVNGKEIIKVLPFSEREVEDYRIR